GPAAGAGGGLRDHVATGPQPAGAEWNQQCHQRHAGARLYRHRGPQAHQGVVRGPVSRVVLQTALGAQCRAVRQEGHQRHLYCHANQRRSGHPAVYRRTNGAKSTYTGVELSWQHFLDMGLGTHMQYTHTWSKGYDQFGNPTGAVNAAPPTTFSVSLIYDKGPFNADVNWDYTSSYITYCSACTEVPGWPAIADSFSWVTASAHYRIYKGFEVYVEGRNLTNAIAR